MENLGEGILLGCGNPLLDISASVDIEFLNKYGLETDHAILAEERHKPLYLELVEKYDADFIAGGSVLNSLRVCQWMLQKPKSTVFFGCVGYDDYSQILVDKASSDGVIVQYQYTDEQPTGTCGVLITGTNRSLCANLAAANLFTIDHIRKPECMKYLQRAEYFYISGFFLTVSPPTIMEVAKHSHNHKRTFMMNLSAAFIPEFFKDSLMEAMPYVDLLFGNEAEAKTFAQSQGWETENLKEIGKLMTQLPKENVQKPRMVILTQGSCPVLLFTNENTIEEYPVEKLSSEEIVDTNGAGDAFVGGFLSHYIQKKPLATCIKAGIFAAGCIIKRSGCTFEGKPAFHE